MRLAELGRFRVGQLLCAIVFDTHTHLRHDIAPALGSAVPATDANRMAVVLEWMMAVLSNQLRASQPEWLDRPVSIALSGPGGGCWVVRPDGSRRTRITRRVPPRRSTAPQSNSRNGERNGRAGAPAM